MGHGIHCIERFYSIYQLERTAHKRLSRCHWLRFAWMYSIGGSVNALLAAVPAAQPHCRGPPCVSETKNSDTEG